MSGPQARGDLNREKIANAIIDSIAEGGIENLSFADVGKRVGMRRSHLVYYFPDRNRLIEAAVGFVASVAQEMTISAVAEAKSSMEKLVAIANAAIEHVHRHPKHGPILLLYYHLCASDAEHRNFYSKIRKLGQTRIAGTLKDLVPGGLSAEKTDVLAQEIQIIITGYVIEYLVTKTFRTRQEAKSAFEQCIKKILDI